MRESRVIFVGQKQKSEWAKDPAPRTPLGLGGWGGTARIPFRFRRAKMEIRPREGPDPPDPPRIRRARWA
jgi:hypothetical protein